ncbi:DEAD/DEAH box helicase [Patescibacteria group bacterium]|nr:DEAD/DEAH box helicase [Patescibacteria group bacterium]
MIDIENLPFVGFVNNLERRREWVAHAKIVLEHLRKGENVGFVADTAAGKTIVALMVILGGGYRTLFATPQKILTLQHLELLQKLAGDNSMARAITGETPREKRSWDKDLVIATPQTVENDIRSGRLDLGRFELFIPDEFHRAVGHYSYTAIAETAHARGLKILGLSASPAGDPSRIEATKKGLFLDTFIVANIKAPERLEDVVVVEPDERLIEAETYLSTIISNTGFELLSEGLLPSAPKKILNQRELDEMRARINGLPADDPLHYTGLSLTARYLKLRHALSLLLTDGYHSFIAYGTRLAADETKAARFIWTSPDFQGAMTIAKNERHPKESKFIELAQSLKRAGKNALVFVGTKETGAWLKGRLMDDGLRAEFLSGGRGKDAKRQRNILDRLASREIDALLATSVVEEGVSIPEVDTVIHYSMPQTPVARKQRNGRTGRLKTGHIVFIRMNNALDGAAYFGTRRKMNAVQAAIEGRTYPEKEPLPLFPGW